MNDKDKHKFWDKVTGKTKQAGEDLKKAYLSQPDKPESKPLTKMEILADQIALVGNTKGASGFIGLLAMAVSNLPEGETSKMLAEKGIQADRQKYFREKVRRLEKFTPDEAFITAGEDPADKLFRAAIMARNPNAERDGGHPYIILRQKKTGHLASWTAKMEASCEFPLLPVLDDKLIPEAEDKFLYPHYDSVMQHKHEAIIKADERRNRRIQRLAKSMEKK